MTVSPLRRHMVVHEKFFSTRMLSLLFFPKKNVKNKGKNG